MRRLRPVIAITGVLAITLGGKHGGPAAGHGVRPRAKRAGELRGKGGGALPPGGAWTVTLVTGDIVRVRTVGGRPPLVSVQPGPGHRNVIFSKFVSSTGQIEVLPHDVAPLVGTRQDRGPAGSGGLPAPIREHIVAREQGACR